MSTSTMNTLLYLLLLLMMIVKYSLENDEQQKPCPQPVMKNGRVKIRGKMAYFECKKKFTRVGQHIAVCLSNGIWSQVVPTCVGRGCPDLGTLPHLTVTEQHEGGVLLFDCPSDMRRDGPQTLMCDGSNWNAAPPKCLWLLLRLNSSVSQGPLLQITKGSLYNVKKITDGNSLGCDFEDSGLCGWSQDVNDDFDWTWISGTTPTSDTGPHADHTTGTVAGHYIFMESSAPQKSGQVSRLISPPYKSDEDLCLRFFYHMKGPPTPGEVGDLDVFIRSESADTHHDEKLFHREGNQGPDWIRGDVLIPRRSTVFKIVFAVTRRESFTSDIALDDIRVLNCSDPELQGGEVEVRTTRTTQLPSTTRRRRTTTASTTPTTTMKPTTSTTRTTTTTTATTTTPKISEPETETVTDRAASSSSPSTMTSPPSSSTDYSTNNIPSSTPEKEETAFKTDPTPVSEASFLPHSSMSTSGLDDSSGATALNPDNNDNSNEKAVDGSSDNTALENGSDAKSTQPGGSSSNSYLQLIVGVTLGVAVGMVVVGILLWLWAKNRRERMERRIMKNHIDIHCSSDDNPYHH